MKRTGSCILFLIAALNMVSQEAHPQNNACNLMLYGQVLDEHDNTTLEYASIYIIELSRGVTANDSGFYEIANICPGIYTIKVTHLNCEPVLKKLSIVKNTKQHFYPEHHAEELSGVDIRAEKVQEESTQSKSQLSVEELNQSKGLSLAEALKNVTGVTSLNSGNSISKPIIHGMHSNRILILNNGVRQEGQQWGVEHAPEVDPFIADKLSVVKGANSVRYGSDAIAGVILVEPKALPDSVALKGEVNLVGMSNGKSGTASGYLEGTFTKLQAFSWRVQGTLKQSGTIAAPNYNLINTGFKEYNFSYNARWKKSGYELEVFYSQFNTTLGIFGASHIGNLTDLQRAFTSERPLYTGNFTYQIDRPYQHVEHELFKASGRLATGNAGKLLFTYARQYNLRNEYDKHRPLNDSLAKLNLPELEFELTSHTADLVWEHNSYKKFTGSIGVSGMAQGNTYTGRVLIPNYRNLNAGLFVIERWKKNKIEIEAGLRYDYRRLQIFKYEYIGNANYELISPIRNFENVSANLGYIYKKNSRQRYNLNFGTAWRAPSVNELYTNGLHHGAAAIEFGDNTLNSERTYNVSATANYKPAKNITIEISPYFHHILNFIYRQPAPAPILTIHGAFPAFNYKQTDANLYGCDIFLNYILSKHVEFTSKISLFRAKDVSENKWLVLMPSDRYEAKLQYNLANSSRFSNSYLSASGLFVTKQWRVPANSDFTPPPPAYFLLNIHATSTVHIKSYRAELGISINNALNTSYRDYLDRFRYFTDAMGRNIVIRLKLPFNLTKKQIKT